MESELIASHRSPALGGDIKRNGYAVLVLRGGKFLHADSITTGAKLVEQSRQAGLVVHDVYVDAAHVWHKNGLPIKKEEAFANVDAYVDLAHEQGDQSHHELAKRFNVQRLFAGSLPHGSDDRESVFRILRQHKVLVPQTALFRKGEAFDDRAFVNTWRTHMTPLLVRSTQRGVKAQMASSLEALRTAVTTVCEHADAQVMTFRKIKPRTIVVLPEYRGHPKYTPLPIETVTGPYEVPSRDHRFLPLTYLSKQEKDELSHFAADVHAALDVDGVMMVDCIKTRQGYMVVDITLTPSLIAGGRFQESIATTGVSLPHYALELLSK